MYELKLKHLLYPLIKYRGKRIELSVLPELFRQTALVDILTSKNPNVGVYLDSSVLRDASKHKVVDYRIEYDRTLYLIVNTVDYRPSLFIPRYLKFNLITDELHLCSIDSAGYLHFNKHTLNYNLIMPSSYFKLYKRALNYFEPPYYFWEPDDKSLAMDKFMEEDGKSLDSDRIDKYNVACETMDENFKKECLEALNKTCTYNFSDLTSEPIAEEPIATVKNDCNKEHTAKPTMKSVGESMDTASSLKDLPEDVRKSVIEAFNKSITNIIYSCTHKLDELNNIYNESDIAGEGVVEDNNIDNEPDESDDIDIERTEDKPDKG